ncbi:MAG: hypothetical protein AB2L20_04285 [Mangrovibacterium sp.]
MKAVIQNNRLILEGDENGYPIKCETILGEKDLVKIEMDPDFVRELLSREREWKISYPSGEMQNYIRLGKLSEADTIDV